MQPSTPQDKAPDAQTTLDGSIKQPQSHPVQNAIQVKLTSHSRKPFSGLGLDAVRIGYSDTQFARAVILQTQTAAQGFNQPVEVPQQ
jgi:hypothetical protein